MEKFGIFLQKKTKLNVLVRLLSARFCVGKTYSFISIWQPREIFAVKQEK
jgi:hypothetical protein